MQQLSAANYSTSDIGFLLPFNFQNTVKEGKRDSVTHCQACYPRRGCKHAQSQFKPGHVWLLQPTLWKGSASTRGKGINLTSLSFGSFDSLIESVIRPR